MAGINNFRREIYTVGWLCALPIELAAARKMLDDHHGNISPKDANTTYMLGRIGKYNVAIACLPKGRIGSTTAATVFTHMKIEFRAIKHWLLVGVGGGVPGPGDVRLGDVVVSYPTGSYSGVVQYDSGKSYPDGFERTGYLNSPSTALLSALTTLQANWLLGESKLLENASRLDSIPAFARGRAGPDNLFRADYHHVKRIGGSNETNVTCGTTGICSKHKIISRKRREPQDEVIVHYGTIASGYQVIKDSKKRDELSALFVPDGVLCFEMEAAGLMNDLQCLVIRGICDYADSHKNERWQPYAAGMAAACSLVLKDRISRYRVPRHQRPRHQTPKYQTNRNAKGGEVGWRKRKRMRKMTVIVVTTKKVFFASIAGALALSLLNVNAVAGADRYIAIIAAVLEL